jgi:thymidylate synthase
VKLVNKFNEALSEIGRDLAEMGIRVHPKTWQDQDVSNNPDFETKELQNYTYTVINPSSEELKNIVTQPYCDLEWADREGGIEGNPCNPGLSWKSRKEVWEEFLQEDGTFAYAYPERLAEDAQVKRVIDRLKEDSDSRQLFISVWNSTDITKMGGISRIPCTLGYLVQCREGRIDLTYLQRSCDWSTHAKNDIFFAVKLQEYIAGKTGYEMGRYTHWLGSLHVFQRDIENTF